MDIQPHYASVYHLFTWSLKNLECIHNSLCDNHNKSVSSNRIWDISICMHIGEKVNENPIRDYIEINSYFPTAVDWCLLNRSNVQRVECLPDRNLWRHPLVAIQLLVSETEPSYRMPCKSLDMCVDYRIYKKSCTRSQNQFWLRDSRKDLCAIL